MLFWLCHQCLYGLRRTGRHSLWSAEFTGPQSISNTHTRLSFQTSERQWPSYVNRQGAAHQQMNGSICIMKFFIYIHIEKNKIMSFAGKWNWIIFMLSKLTQTQKVKSSLFSFTCGIQTQRKAMKVGLSKKRKGATTGKVGRKLLGIGAKRCQVSISVIKVHYTHVKNGTTKATILCN